MGSALETKGYSRGPLARRKTLHTSLNRRIDEVLLHAALWLVLNEREQSMHSLQNICQLLWVCIVCLDPCYALAG